MSSPSLRREVLSSFKKLHRVSQSVFGSNAQALESARKEINDGYRKNINVTEANAITDLIKFAHEVAHEIKVSVVELKPTGPGRYRMCLRPEIFEESKSNCEEESKTKCTEERNK